MALVNCPECGLEVSAQAKNCPKCGYPFQDARDKLAFEDRKKFKKRGLWLAIIAFVSIFVSFPIFFYSTFLGSIICFVPLIFYIKHLLKGYYNEKG